MVPVCTELVAHCLPPSLQSPIPRLGSAYLKTTLNESTHVSQNMQKTCSTLHYKISCSQKATVAKNSEQCKRTKLLHTPEFRGATHY